MTSDNCSNIDILENDYTIILIIAHFVLTVSGWGYLAFETAKGYLEYEEEIFTWYWVFSVTILAGGFNYILYVIYNIFKKCFKFRDYREISNKQNGNNLEVETGEKRNSEADKTNINQSNNNESILRSCLSMILMVVLR